MCSSVKVFQDQTRSSDCFAFLNKFMTTAATPPEQGKTGDLESLVYLENMSVLFVITECYDRADGSFAGFKNMATKTDFETVNCLAS